MTTLLLIEHVPASHLIIGMIIFVILCVGLSLLNQPKKKVAAKR